MFRRILVPIDGSPTSNRGLDEAIGLATDQKARICLLHVADEIGMPGESKGAFIMPVSYMDRYIQLRRAAEKKLLAQAEAKVRKHGIAVDSVLLPMLGSGVADLIIKQAKKWRADVI